MLRVVISWTKEKDANDTLKEGEKEVMVLVQLTSNLCSSPSRQGLLHHENPYKGEGSAFSRSHTNIPENRRTLYFLNTSSHPLL